MFAIGLSTWHRTYPTMAALAFSTKSFAPRQQGAAWGQKAHSKRVAPITKAGKYDDELLETAVSKP